MDGGTLTLAGITELLESYLGLGIHQGLFVVVVVQSHLFMSQTSLVENKNGDVGLINSSAGTAKLNSHELQFALLKHDRERNSLKGSRRGKLDIIAEILLFCDEQKTKTSIMYNTNLNYAQLKSHMSSLTAQGLLSKNLNKYVTTEKGYRFLELFAQLNDLLNEFTN